MSGFFIGPEHHVPDPNLRREAYDMSYASALWSMGMIKACLAADGQGIKEGLRFVDSKEFAFSCILTLVHHIQMLVNTLQKNGIKSMYDTMSLADAEAYAEKVKQMCDEAEQFFLKAEKAPEN